MKIDKLLDIADIEHTHETDNTGLGFYEYLGKQGIDKGFDVETGEFEISFEELPELIREDLLFCEQEIQKYLILNYLNNLRAIEFELMFIKENNIYINYEGVIK